jgi:excisionase family DNA binding protein
MSSSSESSLFNIQEASLITGDSVRTLYRRLADGTLKRARTSGRMTRFSQSNLDAYRRRVARARRAA